MIDDYLKEKEDKIHVEKLIAWREFYIECNNSFKASIMDKKIERFNSER